MAPPNGSCSLSCAARWKCAGRSRGRAGGTRRPRARLALPRERVELHADASHHQEVLHEGAPDTDGRRRARRLQLSATVRRLHPRSRVRPKWWPLAPRRRSLCVLRARRWRGSVKARRPDYGGAHANPHRRIDRVRGCRHILAARAVKASIPQGAIVILMPAFTAAIDSPPYKTYDEVADPCSGHPLDLLGGALRANVSSGARHHGWRPHHGSKRCQRDEVPRRGWHRPGRVSHDTS
jgi:hypothetical protein